MTTMQPAVLAKSHDDICRAALKQKFNMSTYDKSITRMIQSEIYSYLLAVEKDFLTPRNYNNKTKTAHSEFYTLANKNKSFTASHFFRRGAWIGSQINIFSEEYYKTLKNLHRIIKPNGYIITDLEFLDEYAKVSDINDFKQIGYGIFQKTNKSEVPK